MQTLPGLAHPCCQQPTEAAGPCLPYTKAPGTLHYHAMFSDWETVPWACCTETAPPYPHLPNRCCLISSLSSRAPGHLDRTTTTPLPLSLCVWQHSHIPQEDSSSEQHGRSCYWRNKDSAPLGGAV